VSALRSPKASTAEENSATSKPGREPQLQGKGSLRRNLQYAHAEGVAKDSLRVSVEAVCNVRGLQEEGERVGLLRVHEPPLHELLDLLGALLFVAKVQDEIDG